MLTLLATALIRPNPQLSAINEVEITHHLSSYVQNIVAEELGLNWVVVAVTYHSSALAYMTQSPVSVHRTTNTPFNASNYSPVTSTRCVISPLVNNSLFKAV